MQIKDNATKLNLFTFLFMNSVFILSIFCILFYLQIIKTKETENLITHTFKVQLLIEQLFSNIKDAETGTRGYILTGDDEFQKPYLESRKKIQSIFREIRFITSENHTQQKNLDVLKPLINKRYKISEEIISGFDNKKSEFTNELLNIKLLQGKIIMDKIRDQTGKMMLQEDVLLKNNQLKNSTAFLSTPVYLLVLLIFTLLLFVAGFLKIKKNVNHLKLINNLQVITKTELENKNIELAFQNNEKEKRANELIIANNEMDYQNEEKEKRADELIIANKELAFQNNEKEKRADELTIANKELAFQNEEKGKRADELTIANRELAFQNNEKEKRANELIIANNELDFQNNEKEKRANELIIANKELAFQNEEKEKRANELIIANKELSAFTYIASHDLQEPLRKTQLFISRILDDKEQILSEKNADYFRRMQTSANRMQILINDLLAYSRVNETEKEFADIKLNEVIKNLLEEMTLVQSIEDTKTVINSGNLPEIKGISFQLEQLFTNLITNSIKYSNPERTPVINIHSKIIQGKEVPDEHANPMINYHLITIADNGIGFEQQYAEKIFILFQRLHDKETYSGTGIGLTICKKIVVNHFGYITVQSEPEIGTTFNIYIPAA